MKNTKGHVLITGASGLIGTRLTQMLLSENYTVSHLSRNEKDGPVKAYVWDVKKSFIDDDALEGVDVIVHLAGAGVAEKRWTPARKKEILESRAKSSALLFNTLKSRPHNVKAVISASAMGYYGMTNDDHVYTEDDPAGTDFLATVTRQWEEEVDKISTLNIRVVKLRIGVVFGEKGSALQPMAAPVKWFAGAALGTGDQFINWIHIDDVCNMFVHAIENPSMTGPYNAVSSIPVTNRDLTKAIAHVLHRPFFLPRVPSFALRLFLGEMADIVLKGSKLSAEKIKASGFKFAHDDLKAALNDLLISRKH